MPKEDNSITVAQCHGHFQVRPSARDSLLKYEIRCDRKIPQYLSGRQ
ncbi:MAG: hypothetical protein OEL58_04170 [Desulfobacteraceae bacterium]|nr:hypothetical protein [Desulfobacteraceae bacterium]